MEENKILDESPKPRRRIWRTLLLILGVILVVGLGPYFVSRWRSSGRAVQVCELTDVPEAHPKETPRTLRILTYNIAHGRGPIDDNWAEAGASKRAHIANIAKLIAESKADVVVLNEVDFQSSWSDGQNQAEAIAKQAGFRYRVEQRNLDFRFVVGSWKFGNAVLSRYPITAKLVHYSAVSGWERILAGRKQGVVCTVRISPKDVSPQRFVKIVAVHLETRDATIREQSMKKLLEVRRNSDVPVILAGDFNATLPGFPHEERLPDDRPNENSLTRLLKTGQFRTRPTEKPDAAAFTYSAAEPDRVIDWILIPERWRFESYRVLQTDLSDHRPVLATIRISEPE